MGKSIVILDVSASLGECIGCARVFSPFTVASSCERVYVGTRLAIRNRQGFSDAEERLKCAEAEQWFVSREMIDSSDPPGGISMRACQAPLSECVGPCAIQPATELGIEIQPSLRLSGQVVVDVDAAEFAQDADHVLSVFAPDAGRWGPNRDAHQSFLERVPATNAPFVPLTQGGAPPADLMQVGQDASPAPSSVPPVDGASAATDQDVIPAVGPAQFVEGAPVVIPLVAPTARKVGPQHRGVG